MPQQDPSASVWSSIPWGTILVIAAIVLVLVLIVVAVVWWRRRRRSAPARTGGPSLTSTLAHIYKPFYRHIPLAAHHYPTVVVMGEAGVGKSHVIDSHVDWRGQANQFHPSHTQDALLQLYLGPGVVVHELSAPLLRDVSRDAERGLSRLWRRLGRKPVTAVVALNADTVASTPPQRLAELAQLVRGKLEVLAARGRRPIDIRLCLTHLDRIDGYAEFARLLRRRGHELRIETDHGALSDDELGAALNPFEGHLALALTTCSPDEFRHVVRFYRHSPALFTSLTPLLRTLRGEGDPFARELAVSGVYLSAADPDDHVGDPFAVDRSSVATDIARVRRTHLAVCGGLLGAATVALGVLFAWHGDRVSEAAQTVERFADMIGREDAAAQAAPRRLDAARERTHDALDRVGASEVLWLARSFVPSKESIADSYVSALRSAYLLPRVDEASSRQELLYAAALIYASRGDELGALIASDPRPWVDMLDLPRAVILDYVRYSDAQWSGTLELPEHLLGGAKSAVPAAWAEFFARLESALASERIAPAQLRGLRAAIPTLGAEEQYDVLGRVAEILARDERLSVELAPLLDIQAESDWVKNNYASLAAVTALVRQSSLGDVPGDIDTWTLAQLLTELHRVAGAPSPAGAADAAGDADTAGATGAGTSTEQKASDTGSNAQGSQSAGADQAAATRDSGDSSAGAADGDAGASDEAAPSAPPVYTFALPGKRLEVSVADWDQLLMRSRAGRLIDRFRAAMSREARSPFFRPQAFYPSAGSSAGALSGTTQGPSVVIPGIYTKRAFTEDVLPVLTEMSGGLTDVLLAAADRDALDSYVQASLQDYAFAYGQELDNYYRSFQFAVRSVDELIFELQAMSRTTSWFMTFLRTVADNAALELPGQGPFFDPMTSSLAPFQSIVALMAGDAGKYPNLDPYLAIIDGLAKTLSGGDAGGGGDEPGLSLNAAGTLALAAVQGQEKPLTAKVQAWLSTAAIDAAYHRPFLAPVEQAYQLGYQDIERAVAAAWQGHVLSTAQPLLSQFPFDRRAAQDAAIADIEAVFLPDKGTFWQAFATYIQPVCEQRGGAWRMRSPIRPPRGMLGLINRAAAMTAALWDAKGNPQPLSLRLTPQPLPTTQVQGRVATLSFLNAGSAAVYGFNQKPESQTLDLEWWSQGTSSVGVQLRGPGKTDSKMASVDVVDSPWSFYRLLDKAAVSRPSKLTWKIPVASGTSRGQIIDVPFALATDPWAIFELQSAR